MNQLLSYFQALVASAPHRTWGLALVLTAAAAGACQSANASRPESAANKPTATYNTQTGKLTELDFDRNGDGKIDTRAFMDGVLVKSIEIDRDGNGKPDRWEYYEPVTDGPAPPGSPDGHSVIVRAEEANGKNGKITRREFYEHGLIARVEEDTDGDGKVDKWEYYRDGLVETVELDLSHRGKPERRLVYRPDGTLDHVEVDARGNGQFKVVSPAPGDDHGLAHPGRSAGSTGKGG